MARRKKRKLNRKVVIILAVIGGIMLLGACGVLYKFRNRIWPRDPAVSARMGDEALANKDYAEALNLHKEAVGHSQGRDKTDRLLRLSEVALKCLEATPADQPAQRNERFGLFRSALEEAKRQTPNVLEPRKRLADLWFSGVLNQQPANRPYAQFLEEAEGLLQLDPADHVTVYRRAIVYALRSDADVQTFGEKARVDFRKAVDLKKDSIEYWIRYLSFLQFLRAKDRATPEQIIQTYEEAIKAIPQNPDFYVGLGSFKYRMIPADDKLRDKARGEVLALYKKAIEMAPEQATGYLAVAEVLINEGVVFDRKGDKTEAAAMYDKAMAVLNEARKNTDELHRVCHMQAAVYERQGLFAKGIDAYRQAIVELQTRATSQPASRPDTRPGSRAMSPEVVKDMTGELYYRLGHALLNDAGRKPEGERQPSVDEARKCLVKMKELTSDETSVNLESRLLLGEKNYDEAFRLLQATYDRNPNALSFQNKTLLADLCMSKNVPTKAQAILKDLPETTETDLAVQVLLLKARCRMMFSDAPGANALLEEVLRRDPTNKIAPEMRAQLDTGKDRQEAAAKWRSGERDAAISDMERIAQRNPNDVQAIRDLATMYDAAGQRPKLLALLAEARKRMPDDKNIQIADAVYRETDPARRKQVYFQQLQGITDPFERAVQLAQYYVMSDQTDQAAASLEQAHTIKPKDKGTMGQLFLLELQRNKYDAARKWATELAAVDPDAGQAALGELAMTLRDPDAAIAAFTKVLANNKQAKEIYVNRGRCYARKEKYDLAQQDFRSAWDLDNRYLDAAVGLAQTAAMRKDVPTMEKWVKTAIEMPGGINIKWVRDRALAMDEKRHETVQSMIQRRENILAVDGNDEDNRLRLGDLYMRTGDPTKAEEQFTFVYGHSKAGSARAAAKLAELYQNTRRPEKAKGILNDLAQKSDDHQGAMLTYADYLLRSEGATPDCRKVIDAAIKLNEKDPRGYAEMARFYETREQWDDAVGMWDKVLALGTKEMPGYTDEEIRSSQIEATIRTRQFEKSKKAIDALFAQDKNDLQAFLLLNMWHQEQGQTDKAKEVLAAALKVHENVAVLYRAKGALHMRLGELQEAQTELATARKLDPNDPLIGMTLGGAFERSHMPDKARGEYVGVISQNPSYRPGYERLLVMYLKDQDWGKFAALLEQAKQTFPDDPSLLMREGQMWLQRKELEKGLAKMKQASEMPRGNDIGTMGAYLATLGSGGRYAEVLSVTEKPAAQPNPPGWLVAARAAAMVKQNQPVADAEALFVQASKTMAFGEGSYIIQRAREAFGDAAAAEKVKVWGQAIPKNWEWQLEVGILCRQFAAQSPKGPQRDERIRQAVAELTKARDLVEESNAGLKADIDFNIGTFLQLEDKPREAEQAYLRVLKGTPRHMLANNNLAVLYCDDLDEPKKAVECAETIMKFHEVDANALDTYGWALARTGEIDKALAVLTRAKIQDPDMVDIRYHLGWTLEQLKRTSEARIEYRRGMELIGARPEQRTYKLLQAGLERTK